MLQGSRIFHCRLQKSIDEIESSPVVKKPYQIETVMMN